MPTFEMAECAQTHPRLLIVGRNATCAWVSCNKCGKSSSWRTMEFDWENYSALVRLQDGKLGKMHLALRTKEASSCVICAAPLTERRGQQGVPVTWCKLCAARLCLEPYCRGEHNRVYHPHPPRRGCDLARFER